MRFLLGLVLACLLSSAVVAQKSATDEQRVVQRLTPAAVKAFFNLEGFSSVEIDEDNDLIVRMNGKRVLVTVSGNENRILTFIYAVSGTSVTLDDVNRWNRDMRFTKAYLDSDNDPVLEMDVDIEGGVTAARLRDAIRSFSESHSRFMREVIK